MIMMIPKMWRNTFPALVKKLSFGCHLVLSRKALKNPELARFTLDIEDSFCSICVWIHFITKNNHSLEMLAMDWKQRTLSTDH